MIDWSVIDTVLLDMDGTLLDLHFDNYFWQIHVPEQYGQQHGLTLQESQTQLAPRFAAQQGSLNWYCLDYWTQDLGLDIVQLKHNIQERISLRADALDFLEALAASNKQVWLVTNAHPQALALKLNKTLISHYFDHIVSSHQFGKPKEQLSFWADLQHYAHFDPQRTLFIDDSESVLKTASAFGIKHIFSIHQPDSQHQQPRHSAFKMIEHFKELLQAP
ncbi:MAG: GMP/IMP nucleotidase [Moraxellaceae bacterium]|nr:GMP/IMP nucleotidase [Pseudomonadales bacterium]MCP5175854.1 GMP/IMP nucleotidase [Moraxellaceae bacterium]MCP5177665.1 GMP/IMP nucleotidase [Moraxellaceae bacterium]